MKKIFLYLTFLIASGIFQISKAQVRIEVGDRCSVDSLDVPQAIERTEWATKCGYLDEETKNYYLFTGGQPRARPRYPIFTTPALEVWKAPTDRNASCDRPAQFTDITGCLSSCYTPDQRLAFIVSDEVNPIKKIIKWIDIETAFKKQLPNVLAVAPESTLDNIKYMSASVSAYSHEFKDAWNDILEFRTAHGGKLKVTPNHPILDGDGRIREAGTFLIGDAFVAANGTRDPIVSIDKSRHFGQVYNLDTKTKNLKSKLVLAEGFVNGTLYYQNDGFGYMNRKLLREQIAGDLL